MAEAVQTVRFRSRQRFVYARSLLALTELARTWTGPPFTFGPASVDGMEQQGLVVSGPDISQVLELLGKDPGLVEVEA